MEVRTAVARWLSDNPALPYRPAAALVEALMSQQGPGSAPAKLAAARLSARLPAPEAVPLLRACLRDGNPEISEAAALAAGKAGRLEVVIDIVRLLTDRRLRPAMREALVAYGARIAGTLGDLLANPEEDIGLRREIPWVLARIEIPRSADVLTDSLVTPDSLLKYRVIKALNRLHGQRPDLQLPLQAIEVHIYAEVRGYYETLSALQALSSGRGVPVSKLLAKSLREYLDERQELIFRLLGLHYCQRDIHSAYKAIKTGTPDRRASAIEYLESLLQKDLRSMLQPMLEETSPERTLERISKLFAVPPPTPDEALEQLLRRDERWLKSCALHHVGAARLSRFKERCAELTRHADPLIQETALWATRSLDA
jgi:HEAT repeat protein